MKKIVLVCICSLLFAKTVQIDVEKIIAIYKDDQTGGCAANSEILSMGNFNKDENLSSKKCEKNVKKVLVGYKNIGYLNGKEYFEISDKPLSKIVVEY